MNIDEVVNKDEWQINTHILNERWNEVDNKLSTFYSKNTKINRKMYANLQSIFEWIKFSYDELDDYASTSDIIRLRDRIEELREKYGLDGYIGYQLNQYARRKRLKNRELLLALLMVEYYRQYKEQNELEAGLFDELKQLVYPKVSIETITILKGKKKVPKKIPEVDKVWWLGMILKAGYTGYEWLTLKEGTLGYNVKKLFEAVLINMQQKKTPSINNPDIRKLLDKQQKAYFNKTPKERKQKTYTSEYNGSVDNQIVYLVNQLALKAMKDNDCKKVKFVAVLDEKTTKMCKDLDGQIFDIYGVNKYIRYSDEDKKRIEYTTKGLETGANLPPINNHYHHCRSTIYPYK